MYNIPPEEQLEESEDFRVMQDLCNKKISDIKSGWAQMDLQTGII